MREQNSSLGGSIPLSLDTVGLGVEASLHKKSTIVTENKSPPVHHNAGVEVTLLGEIEHEVNVPWVEPSLISSLNELEHI